MMKTNRLFVENARDFKKIIFNSNKTAILFFKVEDNSICRFTALVFCHQIRLTTLKKSFRNVFD
jgi:hypothetical protein